MSDSLLVAVIETLGGASQSTYKVSSGGLQFGAPEPDQATVASLLLDGDVVTGIRAKNRSITLPITVFATGATSQAIRSALTLACDALLAAVDVATFPLQWTPDGGLPIIWDCYRARGERQRSIVRDNQGVTMVTLTFQAKPYGRSPDVQTVSVGSTLQIDSFDTAPTGATLNTTTKYEGTGSGQFTSWSYIGTGINPGSSSDTMSRTFAVKDISAYSSVSLRLNSNEAATFTAVTLTLTSASGSTQFTGTVSVAANQWAVVYLPLTGGTVTAGTGVTLSAVTGWTLSLFARNQNLTFHGVTAVVLADDMRAAGTGSTIIGPTSHAAVISVPVSLGSARTPANLALTPSSGTLTAFVLHSPPVGQDPNAAILSALSNSVTDQTITVPTLNSRFSGTYAVFLGVDTVGSGSITATVTITQKENGTTVGVAKVLTKTYTAGVRVVPVGKVALPLYAVPNDNTTTTYTIEVAQTGAERYSELMLLDTAGQTIFTDSNLATAAAAVYADEPAPTQSGPPVYASASDRTAAYAVLGNASVSGGPILLEPGTNKFLAWVSTNTPVITATYFPRWQDERTA